MWNELSQPDKSNEAGVQEIESDLLFLPSEVYHESSKLHPSDTTTHMWINLVNTSLEIRQVISRPFPHYRGYPSTALPREFPPTAQPLEKVITERRSVRKFSGAPMSLTTLAKILYLGDGIALQQQAHDDTVWSLRTAPSPGGLYPIDLYCIVMCVADLVPGLYFYNPPQHCLERLVERDFRPALATATFMDQAVSQACVCIVMGAIFPRVKFKYGERAYRFALLEAGHIAQNMLLAAQAEGLGAVPVGGFTDDEINQIVRYDGVQEAVLYLVLIGCL